MSDADNEPQNPSNETDGRGENDSEEQSHRTKITARCYNQEVEIESHEASAEELQELAEKQLNFQFKQSLKGEMIAMEEQNLHPLHSSLGDD